MAAAKKTGSKSKARTASASKSGPSRKKTVVSKGKAPAKSKATTKKVAVKTPPAKKTAPKQSGKKTLKPVSKKASVKKSAAKKTIPKKSVAKKATAKKSAVKKTPAKKSSAAQKPANRKAATQKKTASKPVNKKSPAQKPVVSKTKAPKPPAPQRKRAPKSKAAPEFPTTSWGLGNTIYFEATEHQPPRDLTCIAGGFVFYQDKMILANIPGRGWEIIGGRIDHGESPEETFRREAMRQIGVDLAHVKMLGVIRIEHNGPEPPNCPYPYPVGYGVQFIGIAEQLAPFAGNEDSLGRSLISFEGIKNHYYEWNDYNEAVIRHAFEVYEKLKKKLKR